MKVTIITACLNRAGVIGTALESVLRQTWPEIEYLVVDGGSTDGTIEIVKQYEPRFAGRMRWVSEPDRGMYDAINKGIAMATGDVVGILNADDALANDDVVERVAEALGYYAHGTGHNGSVKGGEGDGGGEALPGDAAEAKLRLAILRSKAAQGGVGGGGEAPAGDAARLCRADVVYGDVRFVGGESSAEAGQCLAELRGARTVRYYSARRWRLWMLRWGYMPPHPSVYIRRECYEKLGGYALDYRIAADYALLVKFLHKAGLRMKYLPLCMVDMRMGGRSTNGWRSNLIVNQEIVRGHREAGYFCCLAMLLPKYLFKIWEFLPYYRMRKCTSKRV